VLVLALAAGATADEPLYEAPTPGSYELPPILRVDEHELIGPDGAPAPLLGLSSGDAAIVSFVYLSCGEACPLSTATLHRLDRELAGDPTLRERVQLVTVSFDPARDTPKRMAALVEALEPRGRWRFLTAPDEAAIAPVLADFGQDAVWIPSRDGHAPDRLRHVLKVFLVDDAGAVRNIYSTGLLDLRLLLADLRTILKRP
jgi:cytochrome oxidase Cu insertion factor (SCO1/SenC/PrrC family)